MVTGADLPSDGGGDRDSQPSSRDGRLIAVLEEAQRWGFLGPRPVREHVVHAERLVPALPAVGLVIDLGSGGGVPALVLALHRPTLGWVLVESRERRATWLCEAVARAGIAATVEVRHERAETTGRGPLRGAGSVVTARSFAAPGVTAECAAPLLAPGGRLWVAEPPAPSVERWPSKPMHELGLRALPPSVPSWAGFEAVRPCPERYPRAVGVPSKRPLF